MKILLRICALATLLFAVSPAQGQSTDEILTRMTARNQWQDQALLEFRAHRKFYASNTRFKTDSTMEVQTVFRRPDQMESTVTRQEGSRFIRSRVFDKILEAESETRAKKDKQQVDITPANYNFALEERDDCDGRSCFRLENFSQAPRQVFARWSDLGGRGRLQHRSHARRSR